jgi:hypothetical protein
MRIIELIIILPLVLMGFVPDDCEEIIKIDIKNNGLNLPERNQICKSQI